MSIPFLKPSPPPIKVWSKYLEMSYAASTFSNGGPCVKMLEERLKHYLHLQYKTPVLMCNATVALTVALQALGIKGRVLLPSFTFAATAHSVKAAGLDFDLVDCGDDCFLSLDHAQKILTEEHEALIVVHALGYVPNYNAYERFAKKNRLKLIFDSAASLGASYDNGFKTGVAGDCEVFSLHVTKSFGIGEGALVTSRNEEFLKKCRQIINFGFDDTGRSTMVGTNAKMSEFHAAVGLSVLETIDQKIAFKNEIANRYKVLLTPTQIKTLNGNTAHQVFPILFPTGEIRDKAIDKLRENEIGCKVYYVPLHHHPYFPTSQALPKTDDIASRILCIPFFESIRVEEQIRVVNTIGAP